MKRSGPPARRTGLRTDAAKTRAWQDRSRAPLGRSALSRGRSAPRRRRLVPADWFDRVVALQGPLCVVTRRRAQHAHHAFEVQWLASNGLGWLASDPRIGVPVTRRVHERHTLAVRRIPRRRLPPSVELVAFELGLEWYLERYYG